MAKVKKFGVSENTLNQGLMTFLQEAPTQFHATSLLAELLESHGYAKLSETDSWSLAAGGKYYCVRNGSSLVAFRLSKPSQLANGFRMVGAHTDSPCLKVKPNPEKLTKGYFQLGVEIYGGVLLAPWFDRDLSLAGRVTCLNKKGKLEHVLLDFERPVATIPNLAIHLDRTANDSRVIQKQKEVVPILFQVNEEIEGVTFRDLLLVEMKEQGLDEGIEQILDYEMSFYDTQPPEYVGFNKDFLASARLDNLLSCYVGLQSFLEAGSKTNALLVCNDHEEVGSVSYIGADGPFLESVLKRIYKDDQAMVQAMGASMMISCDNAHGVHPNFTEKHDESHGPILNLGPVIKVNSNQRYATNSETAGIFRYLASKEEVPCQSFVVRNDMACGSTIGPITAARLGVKTLDVGVPQFAMHSIRELAGSLDPFYLYRVLVAYFREAKLL